QRVVVVETHAARRQDGGDFLPGLSGREWHRVLLAGQVLREEVALREKSPAVRPAHESHRPALFAHIREGDPGSEEFAALFPDAPIGAVLMPTDVGPGRRAR